MMLRRKMSGGSWAVWSCWFRGPVDGDDEEMID
jgi:hypothetical protein